MSTNVKGLCSICCLSYNHAAFIESCIRAIWDQDYKNIEIIAVDDGSYDNGVEILNELAKISPVPMMVIAQKNTGNVGGNFNKALEKAKGEYILFTSLDDKLYPHALSEKIRVMEQEETIAFIANSSITGIDDHENINDTVPPLDLNDIDNPTIDDLLNLERQILGTFYIQGTVFRKDIVDAVNGFDEDMVGDDIILRTRVFRYIKNNPQYSFKIYKTPACYYRIHDNNVHKNYFRQIKIVALYLEKYWPHEKNPKTLKGWIRHTIKNSDFKTGIKVFFINSRTKQYLLSPGMWMVLLKVWLKKLRRNFI